ADELVDGLGFVLERKPLHAGWRHDAGSALQGHADKGDLDAAKVFDAVWGKEGFAGFVFDNIGGEELKRRAVKTIAVQTTIFGMAAALLHPLELLPTFVKLVIADGIEIEFHGAERFDGRLVVEQGREQRRCANQVTCRDKDGTRMRGAEVIQMGVEV